MTTDKIEKLEYKPYENPTFLSTQRDVTLLMNHVNRLVDAVNSLQAHNNRINNCVPHEYDPENNTGVDKSSINVDKSKCCSAKLIVRSGDEGTSHYECSECGKPCDVKATPSDKEDKT